uniref:Uncharacterized protein n=1 Tax=Chromera velia CCMP2878 TaxID=1169474 RepID=A0A0G4FMK1_9ALVE|eukprot:Cvel_17805.t1-p1 / transcript=Cvel_17805.t1 / gene=Cvel_17805 / organism=Chromera_velia_CCMP2878 / gene_product=hypothetical protein / transcript_product=hypothetical protein / location=Cvel_scaffold1442:12034-17525(-) / protein_length=196 / sequence_SO=supercontig / SO=protein_coding / is_pseudo=false
MELKTLWVMLDTYAPVPPKEHCFRTPCLADESPPSPPLQRVTQKEKGIEPPHNIREESFLVETRETGLLTVEVPAILRMGTCTWCMPAEDRVTHSSIALSDDWDHHTGGKVPVSIFPPTGPGAIWGRKAACHDAPHRVPSEPVQLDQSVETPLESVLSLWPTFLPELMPVEARPHCPRPSLWPLAESAAPVSRSET